MSGQTFEEFVRQEICYILDQHEGYQPQALEDELVDWVVQMFKPKCDDSKRHYQQERYV